MVAVPYNEEDASAKLGSSQWFPCEVESAVNCKKDVNDEVRLDCVVASNAFCIQQSL